MSLAQALEELEGVEIAAISFGGGTIVFDPKRLVWEQLNKEIVTRGFEVTNMSIENADRQNLVQPARDCGPLDLFCDPKP